MAAGMGLVAGAPVVGAAAGDLVGSDARREAVEASPRALRRTTSTVSSVLRSAIAAGVGSTPIPIRAPTAAPNPALAPDSKAARP